jgi:hypothetical protein
MQLKLMIRLFADFYNLFKFDEKDQLIDFMEYICEKYRKNPQKLRGTIFII